MTSVAVSHFRAHLPAYLKKVQSGEKVVIVSYGEEVAWLIPPQKKIKGAREKLKKLSRHAFVGDVISPIESEWKVNK